MTLCVVGYQISGLQYAGAETTQSYVSVCLFLIFASIVFVCRITLHCGMNKKSLEFNLRSQPKIKIDVSSDILLCEIENYLNIFPIVSYYTPYFFISICDILRTWSHLFNINHGEVFSFYFSHHSYDANPMASKCSM